MGRFELISVSGLKCENLYKLKIEYNLILSHGWGGANSVLGFNGRGCVGENMLFIQKLEHDVHILLPHLRTL